MENILSWLFAVTLHKGVATTFLPEGFDKFNPVGHLACFYPQKLQWNHMVVAHKTLPCKSRVLLYSPRTGKSVLAVVGDRGPRRAAIDLAPAVAKALEHNGKETIIFFSPRKQKP